ncbi:MAG: phosphoglucomutase/phosphomannomutase family protein [Chloroflexi bacterium]|nr:phosphoglucomutase/phosphomannomutase family protein [Chloroflexota bacterium]
MAPPIRFGTDGWRGTIAEDFTFDNVRRCTQGVASFLKKRGMAERGLVVGYDTRFASEHFAMAVAEVLAGNGIRAYLCQRATPTPAVSYSILSRSAAGAIVITASHNPPTDNGFKVRSEYGGATAPADLEAIEAEIAVATRWERLAFEEGRRRGLIEIFDPAPDYIQQLQRLIDVSPLRDHHFKIAVDAMWGAGAGWLPRLLGGGKTRVRELHGTRHPLFPEMERPEPIPPNLDALQAEVRNTRADLGLALDGDADRVGLIDERGEFVTQLQVYALLALYLLEVRGWRGPIVKTLSTTSMLYQLGQLYNVPVYETGVGFKFVAPKMLEVDALIGGEESGGFAFREHVPERDGILASLFLLDLMRHFKKTPSQMIEYLYAKVGPHHYDRRDRLFPVEQREAVARRLREARPKALAGLPVTRIVTQDGFKYELNGGSWLLIRFSGTEPKIRVYAEAPSPEAVGALLDEGLGLVGMEG